MKLLLATTSYPRFEGDSAGGFVRDMALALRDRGHTITVLAPEPAMKRTVPLSDSGIRLCHVPYIRPRRWARTFYGAGVLDNLKSGDAAAWFGLIPYMARLDVTLKRETSDVDAIISHWAIPSGLLAARHRSNHPHIAVLHSADVYALRQIPWGTRLAAYVMERSDHMVFVSKHLGELFLALLPVQKRAHGEKKITVMPMGITRPERMPMPRAHLRAQLGLKKFTVLMLTRLVPVKGIDVALTALANMPDVELLVGGEGPLLAQLRAKGIQQGTSVRWLGHISQEDRAQVLCASDVLLVPSRVLASGRTEGMPCAILEAMDAGLAVIASSVGGIPEWVTSGQTGWTVLPERPELLRQAVQHAKENPQLRAALAARARASVQHLTWEHQAQMYERFFTPGTRHVRQMHTTDESPASLWGPAS